MRFCFFTSLSLGFLALIAFTWHVPGTPPSGPATQAVEDAAFKTGRAPASSAGDSLARIHQLEQCFQTQNCDVPHDDARSYRHAVGEALAIALAEHFGNFGADAGLARSAVLSQEPLVQAVGLRMLAALPTSPISLSALENGLRNANDPALITASVSELRRYLGTSYETDAQRIVEELVGYGAIGSASQATSLIAPFINEHSYDEFRELLAHSDSSAGQLLRAALDQYDNVKRSR